MKKKYYVALFIIIFCTLSVFTLGYSTVINKNSDPVVSQKLNTKLANFKTETLNEDEYTLEQFPKGIVVVETFASWCIPCRESYPEIIKFEKNNTDQGISVVAIAYDDVSFEIKSFQKEYGIIEKTIMSNASVKDSFQLRAVPQTLIVKDHVIKSRMNGSLSEKDINDAISLVKLEGTNSN